MVYCERQLEMTSLHSSMMDETSVFLLMISIDFVTPYALLLLFKQLYGPWCGTLQQG